MSLFEHVKLFHGQPEGAQIIAVIGAIDPKCRAHAPRRLDRPRQLAHNVVNREQRTVACDVDIVDARLEHATQGDGELIS